MTRRQITHITLLKNTPFNDFQNTVHFKSEAERDEALLGGLYERYDFEQPFHFVKDMGQFTAPIPYLECAGYNYCTFVEPETNIRYYAYIMKNEYDTAMTTKITIVIDVVMTWTQGQRLKGINNVNVMRQHLPTDIYKQRLEELRTNDDIIKTTTKRYVHQDVIQWKDFYVVFQSSANLEVDAGTVDKPKFVTSKGQTYDKITSPVNLYLCEFSKFNAIMQALQNYPWVSQNIKSILLIPKEFIDTTDIDDCKLLGKDDPNLKKLTNTGTSQGALLKGALRSMKEIGNFGGIDYEQEPHLLRSEYMTCEVYSYDGQNVNLDIAQLPSTGLQFELMNSIGYFNQIAVFPVNYGERNENIVGQFRKGKWLNNAIIYANFNELPNLVDNYKLGMAQGANQRQLAEDRLFSGRVQNILDPNGFNSFEGITSKVFDSMSLLSNGLSLSGVASKMSDEYEFYRTQRAQFADLKLSSPTVTNQSNGYSFQISNDIFGINVKYSAPTKAELNKIRQYYNMFGFEFNQQGEIYNPESMTICNYLKFTGSWTLQNIPTDQMQTLKSLFEGGIRFWHYDGSTNPMRQDVLKNRRV